MILARWRRGSDFQRITTLILDQKPTLRTPIRRSLIRAVMNQDTMELFTQILTALIHHSREHELKLMAIERIAREHPEVFKDYDDYVADLRDHPKFRRTLANTEEICRALLSALRREDPRPDRGFCCFLPCHGASIFEISNAVLGRYRFFRSLLRRR